jgi:hypothetical protein
MSTNQRPTPGTLYYHFKHDPKQGIAHHAFRIIGTGTHTETEELFVVYESLEKLPHHRAVKNNTDFNIRPLEMFLEHVDKPEYNYSGTRFYPIEDPEILDELRNLSSPA